MQSAAKQSVKKTPSAVRTSGTAPVPRQQSSCVIHLNAEITALESAAFPVTPHRATINVAAMPSAELTPSAVNSTGTNSVWNKHEQPHNANAVLIAVIHVQALAAFLTEHPPAMTRTAVMQSVQLIAIVAKSYGILAVPRA